MSAKPTLHPLAQMWNQNCGSLGKVKGCASSRLKSAQARWKEEPDEMFWLDVILKIASSDFCTGKVKPKDGRRPWKASFDWLIKPDSAYKVLEGKYDESNGNPSLPALSPEEKKRRYLEGTLEHA